MKLSISNTRLEGEYWHKTMWNEHEIMEEFWHEIFEPRDIFFLKNIFTVLLGHDNSHIFVRE